MYAYRNASGNIIGLSTVERTLAQAQAVNPDIASVDASPPQADIDVYNDAQALREAKQQKLIRIDTRTEELVAAGFYDASRAKRFRIDDSAMVRYTGVWITRNDPGALLPYAVSTYENDDVETLSNSAQVNDFFFDMQAGLRAVTDSGVPLKQQVVAATTLAEVAAVEDTR